MPVLLNQRYLGKDLVCRTNGAARCRPICRKSTFPTRCVNAGGGLVLTPGLPIPERRLVQQHPFPRSARTSRARRGARKASLPPAQKAPDDAGALSWLRSERAQYFATTGPSQLNL